MCTQFLMCTYSQFAENVNNMPPELEVYQRAAIDNFCVMQSQYFSCISIKKHIAEVALHKILNTLDHNLKERASVTGGQSKIF